MTRWAPWRSPRGFALILTLSLLALLVLLTFAISSVSNVDGQVSLVSTFQRQARQNARLGLVVAMGKLQVTAGRSDRFTGMAGITGIPPTIDSPTRYWCGVWERGGRFLGWLVSGNDAPAVLGSDVVSLVGGYSVGDAARTTATSTSSREKEHVKVPRVTIQNANGITDGHYGFWVGDEGMKISAYVPADEIPHTTGGPMVSDKLNSTQRRLWSTIQSMSVTDRAKFINYEQLVYAGVTPSYLQEPFHFLTLRARFLEGSSYVSGRININSASRPLWYSLVSTYNSITSGARISQIASVGRKLADAMVVGPFATIGDFENSLLLADALPSNVTPALFVQTLGGILTTRSDTFRIRAYGDAMNPADAGDPNAAPVSVAYCEAIVQRTHEADPSGSGNRFVITYFRWLGPDDI